MPEHDLAHWWAEIREGAMTYSVDELTRLAFIWAEQDRAAMIDAWAKDTPERAKATNQRNQLRAYRLRRWGRTEMEALEAKPMKLMSVLFPKKSY